VHLLNDYRVLLRANKLNRRFEASYFALDRGNAFFGDIPPVAAKWTSADVRIVPDS